MNTLAGYLSAGHAIVPLQAETVTAAARALVERLVAADAVSNAEKLLRRVGEERPEDLVALGDRAFLVHYRTTAVGDLRVAIGASPTSICRELGESERQCARIMLLVVAPPRLAARYLQVVGAFARLLSNQQHVELVLAARTAEELVALPVFSELVLAEQITVREIMTDRPYSLTPDIVLRDAAREMLRRGIGGVPVVDDQMRVVGLLGQRELLRTLQSGYLPGGRGGGTRAMPTGGAARLTVRDAMTRQVLCVSPDQPLAEVAAMLANKDVDRVPVVREGRLVGLLTRGDIVRKLIG